MSSLAGCIIKLAISIAVVFGTNVSGSIGESIIFVISLYGIISAWWFCCKSTGNYLIGTIAFVALIMFATYGMESANAVLKFLAYAIIVVTVFGGFIVDTIGVAAAIKNR